MALTDIIPWRARRELAGMREDPLRDPFNRIFEDTLAPSRGQLQSPGSSLPKQEGAQPRAHKGQ